MGNSQSKKARISVITALVMTGFGIGWRGCRLPFSYKISEIDIA